MKIQIIISNVNTMLNDCSLTNDSRFEVGQDGARHVSVALRDSEESVAARQDGIVVVLLQSVFDDLAVLADGVLHAVELPAGTGHLYSGLAHMDGNALSLIVPSATL